ncbi:MAG: S41 family peptidase [Chitinophagales bacterium]
MSNKKYSYLLPLIFAIILIAGMQLGYKIRGKTENKMPLFNINKQFNKIDEILDFIEVKYVDSVALNDIEDQVSRDLMRELDPHSFYISQKELQSVNENLEGNFDGIGIEFYILKDTIIVVSPITGGPSETLGIQSGDKIITIEDSIVAGVGISNREVIHLLRGEKGTTVKVGFMRGRNSEIIEYDITRDKIPITSIEVAYMVDDEVGYIKITRFSANTYKEFKKALSMLKGQGMNALILDLRNNPGGYLNAATMISDEFIDGRKLLVYTEGKAYERQEYTARVSGLFESEDLVILIDEGSASASEILAGAVQDWDRGLIIGRRSFGKGLVQEQYELADGSALRLTVARYYTPSGRSIQKPYNVDDKASYHREISKRYENGEVFEMTDSLAIQAQDTVRFYTSNGRPVYSGGGIMPDIIVPIDTADYLIYFSEIRGYIPQFVYDFYSDNQDRFLPYRDLDYFNNNFMVSEIMYDQFINFIEKEGHRIKEDELEVLKPQVNILIKAHLARQLWKNDGFYPLYNSIDNVFIKAYEIIKGGLQREYFISELGNDKESKNSKR